MSLIELMASAALFFALAFLALTYLGYPLLALARASLWPKPIETKKIHDDDLPYVSCILAAHDEGERLVRKVENLLALDYPAERLDIVLVCDGSTDGSPQAALACAPSRISLLTMNERAGKSAALAQAIPVARGELLLLCDVRQRFDDDALRQLVRPFSDPSVGAASGQLVLDSSRGPGAYWRYESMIRRAEGSVDSVIGVSGSIYMIRRSLFPTSLPRSLILDDVYIPMKAALMGYRIVYIESAKAYDTELAIYDELPRKIRTLAGNYQLIALMPELLSPLRNRLFGAFFWHKFARLICPWALIVTLIASLLAPGPLPRLLFWAQALAYALALWGWIRGSRAGRLSALAHTFFMMNLAALWGLWRFIRGPLGMWAPTSSRVRVEGVIEKSERPPSSTRY